MGHIFTGCFFLCRDPSTSSEPSPVGAQRGLENVKDGRLYSYKELSAATQGFRLSNRIGRGGFGSVFKSVLQQGRLKNGTTVAVKVLSVEGHEAKQGEKEFLSEIAAISNIRHDNLVELLGCCIDGKNRMLVYGYVENLSLSQTLFDSEYDQNIFSWKVRRNICLGVARGLAFLHEQVEPHIVHRDIKASNILLDKNFNPKISDFGFAKLFPDGITHISTRVAGTLGYLAPEYALHGKLTRKADTYSFGVLILEIVSGKCITNMGVLLGEQNLLEAAWTLHKAGRLFGLVDPKLTGQNCEEAVWFMKIGLLCVQKIPSLRPKMSAVVNMILNENGSADVQISEPGFIADVDAIKVSRRESCQSLSPLQSSLFSSKSTVQFQDFLAK
ncbi:unnamed protein product [Victoria cruziana]